MKGAYEAIWTVQVILLPGKSNWKIKFKLEVCSSRIESE